MSKELFDKVAEVIETNGWQPGRLSIWHYRGADLLKGSVMRRISAPGLVVYCWADTGRVDFRLGVPANLDALAARLAEPAPARPGEFPEGHPMAVNPPPESGFGRFKRPDTASATATMADPAVENPSISAVSAGHAVLMKGQAGAK